MRILIATVLIFITFQACKKDIKSDLNSLKEKRKEIDVKISQLEKEISLQKKPIIKATSVNVKKLELTTFYKYLEIQGKVDAKFNVVASSRAPGVISKIVARNGQYVSQGQVLAYIDDNVLVQSIREAEQQIVFAKDLYDRQKNLWSQDIGTQIQLISAKNVYDSSIKRKNTLLSQKEMYLVKAPISGFVDDLMVKVGETMSPGSPKGIRIVNANNLKIVTEIGEGNASSINQGDAVFINFPNINYALSSRISFVSKVIDEMSRTFKIEINLPSNSKIKPNMLAEIKVVSYKNPAAISIANGLIQSDSSGEFLMVVKNNKALKVYIKKGETYNGFSEIKEGLTAGEEIITNGYQGLEDGDDVEIIQNF